MSGDPVMAKEKRGDGGGRGNGGEITERLPNSLLLEILVSLEVESLCSAAPVCRTFRLLASQALSSICKLDLSGFTLDTATLHRIIGDNKVIQSLTLDCRKLDDASIYTFAKGHLQELVLFKGRNFSPQILDAVAKTCPGLRMFKLEATLQCAPESINVWKTNIAEFLRVCLILETFWIKFQGENLNGESPETFQVHGSLPKNLKDLLLQPIMEHQARKLFLHTPINGNPTGSLVNAITPTNLGPTDFNLRSLSLVLNVITDALLLVIVSNLPLLTNLCLEDRPVEEPSLHQDMTNNGLQLLGSICNLMHLSLTRNRQYCPTTFRRINDMGVFLLAEGCKNLEMIRLGGFSRVTDAGYFSILHSCKSLKRFEIVNAFFLSDLAFHNLAEVPCSLVELKLISCGLLTCETAGRISLSGSLEVLDLSGCKSIGDQGLVSISKLCTLITLDLSGADITDSGLKALGSGGSPISSLSIRGCKRVTERGVAHLLRGNGMISRTLSSFDLGFMPGVTDKAIFTVTEICVELRELCLRSCFYITDASVEALASMAERKFLKKLDLYQCTGLSIRSYKMLGGPSFHSLRWIGAGRASPSQKLITKLSTKFKERPWVTICFYGCEMGCNDRWQINGHI